MVQSKRSRLQFNTDDDNTRCIPNPILIDILSRLPTKNIFQLKCVSKRWSALISDPTFASCHISRLTSPPQYTMFRRSVLQTDQESTGSSSGHVSHLVQISESHGGFSNLRINLTVDSSKIIVVASCEGLLLCCESDVINPACYLCNPFTKEIVTVPPSPENPIAWGLVSEVENGIIKRYMIAQITPLGNNDNIRFLLFSSETNEWRDMIASCPDNLPDQAYELSLTPAIAYNGILHWVLREHGFIIAYDPFNKSDHCRFIKLPQERSRIDAFMGVCNISEGSFRYMEFHDVQIKDNMIPGFCSWVLMDYKSGTWIMEHSASRSKVYGDDAWFRNNEERGIVIAFPVAFNPINKDVVYLWWSDCMVSFNMKTQTVQLIEPCLTYDVFPFIFPQWPSRIPQR